MDEKNEADESYETEGSNDTIDVHHETDKTDETNGANELVGTEGREHSKGANETDDGNYEKKKSKMDHLSINRNLY